MDKKYSIKISEDDENKRLDSFLSVFFEQKSRTQIQNSIKNGEILINSSIKKPSYQLKENDLIALILKKKKMQ
jgi:23S rRNA pseudouridine1911/1915/1917 synthase